jgi:hypothetical protein
LENKQKVPSARIWPPKAAINVVQGVGAHGVGAWGSPSCVFSCVFFPFSIVLPPENSYELEMNFLHFALSSTTF